MGELTGADRETIRLGFEMEHRGGFCATDRRMWRRCEGLREKGLLKFWEGKKSRFWTTQFFTVTDRARALRAQEKTPLPFHDETMDGLNALTIRKEK